MDHLTEQANRLAVTDQWHLIGGLLCQNLAYFNGLREIFRFIENNVDLPAGEGFDDVVERSIPNTGNSGLHRSISGHHHNHRLVGSIADAGEQIRPVPVGEPDIHKHQVKGFFS